METKEAVKKFSLKFLLLREWKWAFSIVIVSLVWMFSTYFYAKNTLSQVWINTPKIISLEIKSIENEKKLAVMEMTIKEGLIEIKTDIRELRKVLLDKR